MYKILLIGIITFCFLNRVACAQHEGHRNHSEMPMDSGMSMTHSFSRNLPMNRNGSSTSWMPDVTPIYAYMKMTRRWNFMFHGSIFLRYNHQDIFNEGSLGGRQFDATNWQMAMAQRKIGRRGLFIFNLMTSLDPLTVGGAGYPLLFQTGESWRDVPLVNRQHPHDLFSELAIGYTHMFSKDIDLFGYLGYPGEPALGPTAFMHRISAMNNPDAPLGHHWQDATHITFGVATVGFRYKMMKLEGSSFTGREPGENRFDFDKPRFDSYSYRFSVNPSRNFALQISNAFIKSPERLKPEENLNRTTASVLYSGWFGETSYLTTAIVWGLNSSNSHNDHSALFESSLQLNRAAIYGRYEFVQKQSEELVFTQFPEHTVFNINAVTLGFNYTILRYLNTNLTVGIQSSLYSSDKQLEPIYGKLPMAGEVYLRLNPGLLRM